MSIIYKGVEVGVTLGGGGGSLYTNAHYSPESAQITDVSGFTKLANTSLAFGNYGDKVISNLAITDESTIASHMSGGWNSQYSAYYDAENLIGAYGGYQFGEDILLSHAKFYLGRYSAQNVLLYVTVEYDSDGTGNWVELADLSIATNIPYPMNTFSVPINQVAYGLRWIHKKPPNKTSGNTITFFGMTMYEATGTVYDVYVPDSTGLILPPTGYDGFGPLYVE